MYITFIPALYGTLFPNESEAAFSNYRLWESVGYIMAYAYSSHICTVTKLYILFSFLLGGMALYGVVEWRERSAITIVVDDGNDNEKEKDFNMEKLDVNGNLGGKELETISKLWSFQWLQ